MTARLVLVTVLFLATAAFNARARHPEIVPLREPLSNVPTALGPWTGVDNPELAKPILDVLGVDDYLMRTYAAAGQPPVSLYVGYYHSQRQGDTMHSPMNCLPGAGWQPITGGRATIEVPGRALPIEVNHYVIQKGLDRQVVYYWYQSHGRVVASEYWSKAYLVYDAARTNRSDAALVRVITPVHSSDGGTEAGARRLTAFVQVLFPQLKVYLPS